VELVPTLCPFRHQPPPGVWSGLTNLVHFAEIR
jgi:hypothetical protein